MINALLPRFRVDFNRLTDQNFITTLIKHSVGPVWGELGPGKEVVLIDADGDSCFARVVAAGNGTITCRAYLETWLDGPEAIELTPTGFVPAQQMVLGVAPSSIAVPTAVPA